MIFFLIIKSASAAELLAALASAGGIQGISSAVTASASLAQTGKELLDSIKGMTKEQCNVHCDSALGLMAEKNPDLEIYAVRGASLKHVCEKTNFIGMEEGCVCNIDKYCVKEKVCVCNTASAPGAEAARGKDCPGDGEKKCICPEGWLNQGGTCVNEGSPATLAPTGNQSESVLCADSGLTCEGNKTLSSETCTGECTMEVCCTDPDESDSSFIVIVIVVVVVVAVIAVISIIAWYCCGDEKKKAPPVIGEDFFVPSIGSPPGSPMGSPQSGRRNNGRTNANYARRTKQNNARYPYG